MSIKNLRTRHDEPAQGTDGSRRRRMAAVTVASVLLLGLASGLLGCASKPPAPIVLEIENRLGRGIARIERKDCGQSEDTFRAIEDSALHPTESRGFTLPPSCVDLRALDARGRVVGQQYALRLVHGARWVLTR